MLARVLDVIFPPACVACRRGRWPLCAACWGQIALLVPPGCRCCGRPLEHEVERCADCPPRSLSWARAPFLYEGPVRSALIRLKFAGLRATVAAIAPWMVWALARSPPADEVDPRSVPVTWVPLGPARRRARGYDQAEALARSVAGLSGRPARAMLERVVETPPQAKRFGAARRALRGAFVARGPVPPIVVLVDDVLTTGATAASCADALLQAGARQVGVLTAARSLGSPVPPRCYNPPVSQPGSVVARERSSR